MNDQPSFLELADGTRIDTSTGKPVREKGGVQSSIEKQSLLPATTETHTTTRLADFNLEPRRLNGLAALVAYRMIGLPDFEIADAIGVSDEQLAVLLASSEFLEVWNKTVEAVLDRNARDIRIRFQAMSHDAVEKVHEVMSEGDDREALKAAQDILDRAGHRPADIVHHKHSVNGGLRIELIRRSNPVDIPEVNIQHEG